MSLSRTLARFAAFPAAAVLVAAGAGPAAAHVSISPSEGAAGAFSVLTVSVPHGCDGSPTTEVTIEIPEQLLSVTPTRNPLWDVEKHIEKLDEPVTDAHGNQVTERVGTVVYTASDPLPDGYRDAFELSLQLPDAAGETLVFPTIQSCEKGETAWVETAPDGNTEELEAPAPSVTILAPEEGGQGAATSAEQDAEPTESDASTQQFAAETDGGSDTLGVVGLVAGLLGLAAGVAALVLVRRRA